ncbi:MAG: bifunctional UDP-N-acetylglucosamine pyrophosphorylase / Glucosamine-1-phosphate N-acetyltransferase, partial [Microgenomates group bacterium LiPW_16]
ENSRVGALSEVKGSIFLPGSTLGSGFVASSIIGQHSRIAHGFVSANRRFDRKTIKVKVKGEEVDTGLDDLGVIMGEGVEAGIGVGTMPGVTIGKKATIGPGTFVFEDIPPGVNYYTQFKKIVKKT